MSPLIHSQITEHTGQLYFCDICIHYFYSEQKLRKHELICMKMNTCRIKLPDGEFKFIEFKNFKHKEPVPVMIYADSESILKPHSDEFRYQEHEIFSIAYYFQCRFDDELSYYKSYRGKNPARWFAVELEEISELR